MEDPVQRQSQLDHPEIGAEVTARGSHLVNQKIESTLRQVS